MTSLGGGRRNLATSLRVVRAVLRSPALRRVEAAFLLFNAVEFGTWVAILLYAYGATGPGSVGIVALAQLVPASLFAPVAASFADRFPRERVLLAGYLAQTASFAIAGGGMVLGAPPVLVYLAATVAASSLTVTRPAQGSFLPALARTPEELTAANGLSGTMEGAGLLLGPLAAAGILAVGSTGAVFLVGALACVAAAVLVAPVGSMTATAGGRAPAEPARSGEPATSVETAAPSGSVLAGLRVLVGNPDTRVVVALLALRMLTSEAMDVLFVLLAIEVFATGESGAGILNAALGLGTVVGGAVTFALVGRPRLAPALAISALAWGAAIVLAGTLATPWAAPLLIAAGGIGYAACDVTGRTILQRVTPDHSLARVLGGLESVGLAALAVGAVGVSVLVGVLGIRGTVVVVGLLLPAGVALAWFALRSMDARVEVPHRALGLLRLVPIFEPLGPPQLEAVARGARWITPKSGEATIVEGDPGDRYYVIESGRMQVSRDGRPLRILRGPGDGFGEIALLRDVPRTATVRALEPCVLLAIDRADFLEALTGHPQARAVGERVAAERAANVPNMDLQG